MTICIPLELPSPYELVYVYIDNKMNSVSPGWLSDRGGSMRTKYSPISVVDWIEDENELLDKTGTLNNYFATRGNS